MDGTFTGVVDRIVDDTTAVVLVEEDGEVIEQVTVPATELPAQSRNEGGRVSLTVRDDDLVSMEHVEEDTSEREERAESIQEKFDRLSRRLSEE
jgi:Protein of unknown function (DUF3006).